jgi:hypothetical protein
MAGLLLIHLINYSGHRGRSFEEPPPLTGLAFVVACEHSSGSARSLQLDSELEVRSEGGRISILLPRLDLFDLVVIG